MPTLDIRTFCSFIFFFIFAQYDLFVLRAHGSKNELHSASGSIHSMQLATLLSCIFVPLHFILLTSSSQMILKSCYNVELERRGRSIKKLCHAVHSHFETLYLFNNIIIKI